MEISYTKLRDILILQQREKERIIAQKYIEREISIPKSKLAKIVIGPRRAGKTFFLAHYIYKHYNNNYGYVNFDDEQLTNLKDFNLFIEIYEKTIKHKTILLDEIQNLEKWEILVNKLLRNGYDVHITGSNSKLLSKELATALTGRHIKITLLTFSFREYLKALNKNPEELTSTEIIDELLKYLKIGGYPEIIINKEPFEEYINALFDSILYNDIVKRYNIKDIKDFENLTTYLITHISSLHSYSKISKALKTISITTVKNYIHYLEEAFVLGVLQRYSKKKKQMLAAPFKVYVYDLAFYSLKNTSHAKEESKRIENVVYAHLLRNLKNNNNLYYYQTPEGYEVDFLITQQGKIKELIQVSYANSYEEIQEREIRALIHAKYDLGLSDNTPLTIITWDYEDEKEIEWWKKKAKIRFVPLWKWLLKVDQQKL